MDEKRKKVNGRKREKEKEKRKRKRKVTKRKRRKKREKEKENCPLAPRGGSRDKSRPELTRARVCVREVLFEPVGISDRLKACVCVLHLFRDVTKMVRANACVKYLLTEQYFIQSAEQPLKQLEKLGV